MMMQRIAALSTLLLLLVPLAPAQAQTGVRQGAIDALIGESLHYDMSFLWFERLAVGFIEFLPTADPAVYLLRMEARTRGLAALFTSNRIEKFETIVDIGSHGQLRPLSHSSHRITGSGDSISQRTVRYTFDYQAGTIRYERIKNGKVHEDEWFDLNPAEPVYDVVSAFYNLRLGYFGIPGTDKILIPTFHHRGEQEIVVEPVEKMRSAENLFFGDGGRLCRVLMDPAIFDTHSRDVLLSFDEQMRLDKGIIKRVIGLGDLRGVLRNP
jgi:hypothetical protein